ncbi:MAG TPA: ABC transporter permease [Ardenticatenaceae bacterium]|nr:ABC transporter permease [Ardenticatenaceae bacterium]
MNSSHLSQVSWQSYARSVLAIARKDILHFFRYPLNAFFRIVEPLMWLTPIYFLGRSFATAEGNVGFAGYAGTNDYMSFILVGVVLTNYVASVFWGMGYSLKNEMDSGVLETNWMAPVPRPLFLVGQTIAGLAITTFNSAATLLLATLLFGFEISGNLLAAVVPLVPMLVALYGFGFAFAALVLLMRDANTLIDVSNFAVSILSGGNFPVQALPRLLLPLSLALPLTYGFDAVRGLLLGTRTLLPVPYEIGLLVLFMGIMVPLGYAIFKRVERRCRTLGTLGLH